MFSEDSDSQISRWFETNREADDNLDTLDNEENILDELIPLKDEEQSLLACTPIHKTPFKIDVSSITVSPIQFKNHSMVESINAFESPKTPLSKRHLPQSPIFPSAKKAKKSVSQDEISETSNSLTNNNKHFQKLQSMVSYRKLRNMNKEQEELETLRNQLNRHNEKLGGEEDSSIEECDNELEELEKQITQFNAVMRDQGVCDEEVELDEIELQINRFNESIKKKGRANSSEDIKRKGQDLSLAEEKKGSAQSMQVEKKVESLKRPLMTRKEIPKMNIKEQLKRNYDQELKIRGNGQPEMKDKENYKNISPLFPKEAAKPLLKSKTTFCPAPSVSPFSSSKLMKTEKTERKILQTKSDDNCKLDDIKSLLMKHNNSILKPRRL